MRPALASRNLELAGARLLVLDDGSHAAFGIAHDAAVSGRLIEIDGQQCERVFPAAAISFLSEAAPIKGTSPYSHQHGVIVGNQGHGLHHGVSGAQLFGLQNPVDVLGD